MALPTTVETREFDKFEDTPKGAAVRTVDASSGLISLVDYASSSTIYIGEAAPGSLTSSAVWKIQRIVLSNTSAAITLADGNSSFDNVWNNRSGLSYS